MNKTKFRLIFEKENEIIFKSLIYSTNMRGAKAQAKKLEPFDWDRKKIIDLTKGWNLVLDKIEFNY